MARKVNFQIQQQSEYINNPNNQRKYRFGVRIFCMYRSIQCESFVYDWHNMDSLPLNNTYSLFVIDIKTLD
jgi:hypothetical protein